MGGEVPQAARPTTVTIYGRTYQLRGNEDEQYLLRLAALVDRRMREVAEATGTADTLKVAILAALNIADDALQGGEGAVPRSVQVRTGERVTRICDLLEEALAG
jgi:cell division protein ZapA